MPDAFELAICFIDVAILLTVVLLTDYVAMVNELLERCNINKNVSSLRECTASMFVLVLECLCSIRLKNIFRYPQTLDDHIHNSNVVVSYLSREVIGMDLSHISGESICAGDIQSIINLLEILYELYLLMREYNLKKLQELASNTSQYSSDSQVDSNAREKIHESLNVSQHPSADDIQPAEMHSSASEIFNESLRQRNMQSMTKELSDMEDLRHELATQLGNQEKLIDDFEKYQQSSSKSKRSGGSSKKSSSKPSRDRSSHKTKSKSRLSKISSEDTADDSSVQLEGMDPKVSKFIENEFMRFRSTLGKQAAFEKRKNRDAAADEAQEKAVYRQMAKNVEEIYSKRDREDQRKAKAAEKSSLHDQKLREIRIRNLIKEQEEFEELRKKSAISKEADFYKGIFLMALDLEKERLREEYKLQKEIAMKQELQKNKQKEAVRKYYEDQFQMMKESMLDDRNSTLMAEKAQKEAVTKMERELTQKMRDNMHKLREKLRQQDAQAAVGKNDPSKMASRVLRLMRTVPSNV